MTAALSLQELDQKARALEMNFADGKLQKDADRLRERIETGYARIAASGYAADDPRVLEAQGKVANLEDELRRYERLEIPHYFEQLLLTVQRDALRWSVPEGSRLRVLVPNILDVTVKLDNLPTEPPF